MSVLSGALLLLGTFAPGLMALAFSYRQDGTHGLRRLLWPILRWEVGARWYVFAVIYMAVIKLVTAIGVRVISGSWPRFGHDGPIVILVAIIISTPFQSGEEVGWRGYALPRIAERTGYARASIVIGVIWAVWHLPLFFLPGADKYGQSFPIWSLEVVAFSVAITWLYAHTNGSLLLTMIMHSAVNQTLGIVPSASPNASNAFSLGVSSVMWLTTALLWAGAIFFLVRMPRFRHRQIDAAEPHQISAARP